MSLAVDRSQLKADSAQIRTALEHVSLAIQDTHHALGRIEERVDFLQTVVGGEAGSLAERVEYAAQRGDELQRGIYLISANVDRLMAGADTVTALDERLQVGVDALRLDHRSLTNATMARDERLQVGVDALRLDHERLQALCQDLRVLSEAAVAGNARLKAEVEALRYEHRSSTEAAAAGRSRLQVGLDALRFDQHSQMTTASTGAGEAAGSSEAILQSLTTTVSSGLSEAAQRSEALLETLTVAVAVGLGEAAKRSEALLGIGRDALIQGQEVRRISELLVSRADAAAQRSFIPLGSEILMRIPEGMLLVPADDSALVAAMWESRGRLEPGTLKVVTALLQEGDTVIDIGANIGLVTLPAARAVGPTGHVVAVEPAARIADLLGRSLFLNVGPERVTVHRLAAGDEPGTAELHVGATAGHSSLLPLSDSGRSEQVDVARLDDLIEPGRRIKLVKIDAEGFELAVWRGMRRIVAENMDIAIVVEFGPEHLGRAKVTLNEWLDAFLAPGFVAYEIDEVSGRLAPLRPRQDLHCVVSLNLLLVKHPASAFPMLEFA